VKGKIANTATTSLSGSQLPSHSAIPAASVGLNTFNPGKRPPGSVRKTQWC